MTNDPELVSGLDQLGLDLVPVPDGVQEVGRELVHAVQVLLEDVVQPGNQMRGMDQLSARFICHLPAMHT